MSVCECARSFSILLRNPNSEIIFSMMKEVTLRTRIKMKTDTENRRFSYAFVFVLMFLLRLQSPVNPLPSLVLVFVFCLFFIPYIRGYNIIIMLPQKFEKPSYNEIQITGSWLRFALA